jgi:phosphate uptake regulator
MELETRKVQKLGYSSLGISLPKDWAASNGIRPGALVSLAIEDDGSLRVRVGPMEEYPIPAEATIVADEWTGPEGLTRMITGSYLVGCNTIRIRGREELTATQLQEIHEAVRGLTGLTIVNQGPKFVTIENFVEPTHFPIDGLIRRLHFLTSRMEKLALGLLSGSATGNLEEVGRMELEVDRLYWLVVRQLLLAAQNRSISARVGVTEPRHLLGDRVVAVSLENVGDLWEELAAGVASLLGPTRAVPRDFARTIGAIKDKLEQMIELTMTAFFANDLAKAIEALDRQAALIREVRTHAATKAPARGGRRSGPSRLNGFAQIVLRPIEHVTKYYATIAQITVNRALESPARPRPRGAEGAPPPDAGVAP